MDNQKIIYNLTADLWKLLKTYHEKADAGTMDDSFFDELQDAAEALALKYQGMPDDIGVLATKMLIEATEHFNRLLAERSAA